jgi:methanogenic corrinoid protein MtbC1
MSDRDDIDVSHRRASADDVYEAVAAALAAHDKATAVRIAVEAVTAGALSIPELYRDVLARILADTGAAWQTGKTAIWEEHLASSTVRTIVEILYPGVLKAKAAVAPAGRTVLLACPPEEGHDLGLRMVSDRFDMAGWTTFFLGPDTPVAEIADAARRLGVDAVVMSSSTHFHRVAVRHAVDALKKELPGTDIWVGGPAFVGAASGWLPQEVVDLDALLGEPAPGADVANEGAATDAADDGADRADEAATASGEED